MIKFKVYLGCFLWYLSILYDFNIDQSDIFFVMRMISYNSYSFKEKIIWFIIWLNISIYIYFILINSDLLLIEKIIWIGIWLVICIFIYLLYFIIYFINSSWMKK